MRSMELISTIYVGQQKTMHYKTLFFYEIGKKVYFSTKITLTHKEAL